ncbi:GDSL-type esterase/lipase family protein [Oribacterium sp. WCC10]|uniref:GDSL-type esterase/lipase family protein n=1 Tax=Oribacterium sp. WCC10 TaxID=1855343 RepID=UPI0008F21E14|nr:GDSL-type esterase/lipase family protein [Oribacterium sp. WCC10]SFG16563.1 Lysophospholipase L1 [Oribacterium sp. WCC10]
MKKTFRKAMLIALASSMIISSGIISMADETSGSAQTAVTETSAATENSTGAQTTEAQELASDPVLNAQEDQRVVDFYKDSVIIGDSVADGFNKYALKRSANPLLANLKFFTQARYSIHDEIQPIGTEGVNHLWYGGAQHYAPELVALSGARHVYLSLGLNDVKMRPSEVLANYKSLIESIAAANPAVDITIISTTYIYPDAQTKLSGIKSWAFDNDTVRKLNTSMQELAAEKGYGYIDIANRLADANGNLDPKYCTDKYIHQNADAYVVWVQCLREYAASKNYAHANDETVIEENAASTSETTSGTVAETAAATA